MRSKFKQKVNNTNIYVTWSRSGLATTGPSWSGLWSPPAGQSGKLLEMWEISFQEISSLAVWCLFFPQHEIPGKIHISLGSLVCQSVGRHEWLFRTSSFLPGWLECHAFYFTHLKLKSMSQLFVGELYFKNNSGNDFFQTGNYIGDMFFQW